ncbi:MAG: hypothetical protein JNM17_13905 [Archangium sp.]|nr:hypothetical protein [Archangium sp.]
MRTVPLLVLLPTLAACGGISNKLCGAPDQPCCASNTCDPGAVCGADQLCSACGQEGQACCADACSANLSCMSGTCVAPITCMTTCTIGAQRCSTSNGIDTCTASGVCPTWSVTIASCPSGSTCTANGSSADCLEACPGACTVDAQLCTNEGLRICVASGNCPSLQPLADDTDVPICLTGGVVSAELVWESPTPVGTHLVDIGGELKSSYWVLDDLGNIIRYALGPWEYELRATPGKRMKKLASCGLGSFLYAAGENGTVFRRSGGVWTEANVGSTTLLTDVACDSTRAFASGSDGQVYIRSGSTWTGYPTGVTQPFTAVTTLFSQQQVFLAGANGLIVKCEATNLPPTCTTEMSNTTVTLRGLFGDTFTDTVYAVGDDGTLLERRGGTWTRANLPGVTASLVGVTALYDSSLNASTVIAVSTTGDAVIRRNDTVQEIVQLPDTAGLTMPWVPDEDTLVFTGRRGAIFYRNGLFSMAPFVARGGRKPLTQSLEAVTSVGNGRLFAVGPGGARVRRQNGVWSVDALGAATSANLHGIAARNAGEIYAVGDNGTVLIRRFGTWVTDAVGLTTDSLSSVVLDSTRVWALSNTHLYEKKFATGMWRAIALPSGGMGTTLALKKDANGAATELVVAGQDCATWSVGLSDDAFTPGPTCNTRYVLTAAAFSSAGDLFVGTDEGTIYHRTGNTMTFENVMGTRIEPFFALIPDGSGMWAVGSSGAVFRRVSTNWSEAAPDVTTTDLHGGVKDDAEGLFFVGDNGVVLRRP